MTKLKRPERCVNFESIKPELREITEFYTRKVKDYLHCLKQLNEYADELENEISVLKETPKVEVLLDYMAKPLVVVPRLMADWFENQLKNNESKKFDGNDVFRIVQDVIKVSNDECTWGDYDITDEIAKFAEDNEELFLNLIVNCSLGNGYTVEKEKKYILKHIDLSEQNNEVSLYLSHGLYKELQHERYSKNVNMSEIKECHFTQSEIDKIHIGSYEQIEVKVEEVE